MPMIALPSAAFTASILFDVLSLVADDPEHAHSYERGAADLLRLGLSSTLATLALELAEYLRTPGGGTTSRDTRKFAVDGGVIAVYLLDVAARQQRAGDVSRPAGVPDPLPIGLSLLGLVFLAISAALE
jgi:hypothetical protein